MGLGGQGFAAAERARKFVKKQKVFHKKQKKPKNLDDLSYLPSVIQVFASNWWTHRLTNYLFQIATLVGAITVLFLLISAVIPSTILSLQTT